MTIFIEKGQTSVLTIRVIPTMKPIVSTGALYLLSVQIIVEIIGSPAIILRSYNNRISVTAYYRITFGIKICYHSTSFIVLIRYPIIITISCHRVSVCIKITFFYNSAVIITHSTHGRIAHINGICDYPIRIHIACAGHASIYGFSDTQL